MDKEKINFVEELKLQQDLHPFLKNEQEKALANLDNMSFPTPKNEDWKYTNLRPLKEIKFEPSNTGFKESALPIDLFNAFSLRFVNAIHLKGGSNISDPDIELSNLSCQIEKGNEYLKKFYSPIDEQNNYFGYLNNAFAKEGAFIHLKKGAVLEKPVVIHHYHDAGNHNVLSQPRNIFIAEENTQATIIEIFESKGVHSSFVNIHSEIYVGSGANINYIRIQNEQGTLYHVSNTFVHQDKNSVFNSYNLALDGGTIRNNLRININGTHSESNMYGLSMLYGKTHVDNQTIVDHKVPGSYSNELYKNILDEQSSGVFNGKIYVRKHAQKTNAFQSNKNILLTEEARIDTKPQLEIWADDVKCSHGATTGQLDPEAMFYLQARGIPKAAAQSLLLEAFAGEVIEKIPEEFARNYIRQIISKRLSK